MSAIFDFTDYRGYLKSVFEQKKTDNPHFSHRSLANHLGLKAPGHMLFVMQGKRRLTEEVARRLIAYLKLTRKESEYFLALISYCHARTAQEKQNAFDELTRLRHRAAKVVGAVNHKFYEKWYYSAVRASLDVVSFKGDCDALASGICPPITPSQAQEAIEVLQSEGLVKKDEQGCLKPSDSLISSGDDWSAAAIESLRYQFLDLGRECLTRFSPQERDASFLTVTLSQKSFEMVKEKVKKLRAEVLEIAGEEKCSDQVVQCNFVLFPLFRKEKS
ncbi:MAG: TIGR02147 family protein [Chitinispirillaceae bacterium]